MKANDIALTGKGVAHFEDSLKEALQGAGLSPVKGVFSFAGQPCRFDIEGRKRGKKHGWFIGYSEGEDAWGVFGDWQSGYQQSWCSRSRQSMSTEERTRLDERMQQAKAAAEAERKRMAEAAAVKAQQLWNRGAPVRADHPYITTKGIHPVGALQLRDMLLVPLHRAGKLVSMQCIGTDGRKTFLTGGETKGAALVLGTLKDAERVILCEGWATGCTLHEATGFPVVVAFNAGNLLPVAERLAKSLQGGNESLVLVCGDNDHATEGNPGKTAAEKAAAALFPRARAFVPMFTAEQITAFQQSHNGKVPTDFNDLHQLAGLSAVLTVLDESDAETENVADKNSHSLAGGLIANLHDKNIENNNPLQMPDNTPRPEDEDAYIRYLAGLKPLAYGRIRKGAAEALGGVPVSLLDKLVSAAQKELADTEGGAGGEVLFDEVEPWPAEVDGAALLDSTYFLLQRYVIADRETLRAATLWAALTWFTEYATVLPLAVITAPEKGCGKSTLLQALAKLSPRPLYASNITPAALFRAVEAWRPTLLIDEADTFARDNEELRGVLNAGHTRDTARVVRVVEVGGELQPRVFSVWGAKALAGIGGLQDTVMSRAVILTMRRKLSGEKAENLRHADHEAFHAIKRQFARWSDDMGELFSETRPELAGLNNRAADNWEPLLALADLAGGDWPKQARQAALKLTGSEEEAPSLNEELLKDIQAAFENRHTDKLWTADLLEALYADEEAPWLTYNRGKPFTARQLSKRLADFGIKPKSIRSGPMTKKGYELEQFGDAFARYLLETGNLSGTPAQPNNHDGYSVPDSSFESVDNHLSGTRKSLSDMDCAGVPDRTPPTDEMREEEEDAEYF